MKRLCVLLALTGCELLIGDETGGSGFGFGSFPPPPPPPSSTSTNFGPVFQTEPVPRPISGGTMFVSRDGRTAIVADPDRDVVWLVDLVNKTRRDTIELYQGDEPGRGVEDDAGRAHLVLRGAGALLTIQISTGEILSRRTICNTPRGIDYDRRTDELHIACQSGLLITLPAGGGEIRASIELLPDLRDVVVGDDELFVSRFRSAEIIVIKDGLYERRTLPAAAGFAPTVAWRMVALRNGVAVLHQLSSTTELRNNPITQAPEYYGHTALPLCPSLVQSAITVMLDGSILPGDFTTGTMGPLEGVLSVDMAVDEENSRFAVAFAGNAGTAAGSAIFTDQSTNAFGCLTPVRNLDGGESEAISVAVTPSGDVVTQYRAPPVLMIDAEAIYLEREADELHAHFGHAVFHRNSGVGIACASCHPEGGDDGHTWNFEAVGLRRTQSLRAAVAESAPFHWDGDLADIEALIDEVFIRRMRGPGLSYPGRRYLLNWLESIPPYATERPESTDAVERGRALFEDPIVGCSSCHAGARKTNNLSFDVGTGDLLQVPSLIGVSARVPLMHDGCAETLRDRFEDEECGGGDSHGRTSMLSRGELDDLTAYLKTL